MIKSTLLGRRADQILGVTAAAFAATTASGIVGTTATLEADIVDSGVVDILIPDDFDGVYMNLVSGDTGNSGFDVVGWDVNMYTSATFNLFAPDAGTWLDLGGNIFVLPAGTVVDNTQTYFNPGGSVDVGPQVALNAANYFGVEFDNEDTGEVNYAWLEITFGDTAGERSITRFVYDNMGNGVTVPGGGAVPEPTALGLLALGAVGLVSRRRRSA